MVNYFLCGARNSGRPETAGKTKIAGEPKTRRPVIAGLDPAIFRKRIIPKNFYDFSKKQARKRAIVSIL